MTEFPFHFFKRFHRNEASSKNVKLVEFMYHTFEKRNKCCVYESHIQDAAKLQKQIDDLLVQFVLDNFFE